MSQLPRSQWLGLVNKQVYHYNNDCQFYREILRNPDNKDKRITGGDNLINLGKRPCEVCQEHEKEEQNIEQQAKNSVKGLKKRGFFDRLK